MCPCLGFPAPAALGVFSNPGWSHRWTERWKLKGRVSRISTVHNVLRETLTTPSLHTMWLVCIICGKTQLSNLSPWKRCLPRCVEPVFVFHANVQCRYVNLREKKKYFHEAASRESGRRVVTCEVRNKGFWKWGSWPKIPVLSKSKMLYAAQDA